MEGTSSTCETNTPSTIGWSIADRGRYRSGGGWGNLTDSTIYLKVSATTSSAPPPTPTITPMPIPYCHAYADCDTDAHADSYTHAHEVPG